MIFHSLSANWLIFCQRGGGAPNLCKIFTSGLGVCTRTAPHITRASRTCPGPGPVCARASHNRPSLETESYAAVSQWKYSTGWRLTSSPLTSSPLTWWWRTRSCSPWCQSSWCQPRLHSRVEIQPDYSGDASPADPEERKVIVGIRLFLLSILKELTEGRVSTQLWQRFHAVQDGAAREISEK